MRKSAQRSWLTALPFVAGCMIIGFLGSYLGGISKKQPWIDESPKPALWPPQWLFPLVWMSNYIFMGLAAWQVWQQRQKTSMTGSLVTFIPHLVHNFLFIPIVNHLKRKSVYVLMDTLGLLEGLLTTAAFARVSRASGWLMLPYLCWLCFTTYIKVLWWRMNDKAQANPESPSA